MRDRVGEVRDMVSSMEAQESQIVHQMVVNRDKFDSLNGEVSNCMCCFVNVNLSVCACICA